MTEKITIAEYRALTAKGKKKKHPCRLHSHGSEWERDYCLWLQMRQKIGEIKAIRWQPTIPIGDGKKWCIDFEVTENDGTTSYHEAKGFNPYSDQMAEFKLKMSLQHYPDRVIYWNKNRVPPLDSAGRLQLRKFKKLLTRREAWGKAIRDRLKNKVKKSS